LFCLIFVCAIFILVNIASAEISGHAVATPPTTKTTSTPPTTITKTTSAPRTPPTTTPAGAAASIVKSAVSSSSSAGTGAAKAEKIVDYRGYKYVALDNGKRTNVYATSKAIIYLQRPSFGGILTDYFWPDKKIGNVTAAPAGNFIDLNADAEKAIGAELFDQLNGMRIDDNGRIVAPSAEKELKVAGQNGEEISTGMTIDGRGYIHPSDNLEETIGTIDKTGKISMYDPSTYSAATKASLGSVANLIQNTQARGGVISDLTPVKNGGYASPNKSTSPSLIVANPGSTLKPVTTPTTTKPVNGTPTTTKPVTTPTTPSTSCLGLCEAQYGGTSTQDVQTTSTRAANYEACTNRCSGATTNPGTSYPSYPGTSPSYPGTSPSYPGTSRPGTSPGTTSPGTVSKPGTTTPSTENPPGTNKPGTTAEISCGDGKPACPTDKPVCDPTTKKCVAARSEQPTKPVGTTEISCGDGKPACPTDKPVCDPTTKKCVASATENIACTDDKVCGPMKICGDNKKCVPGCKDDSTCYQGNYCTNINDLSKPGICKEGCKKNSNCPADKAVCDVITWQCIAGCIDSNGESIGNDETLIGLECPNNEDKSYTEYCTDGKLTDDKAERCGIASGCSVIVTGTSTPIPLDEGAIMPENGKCMMCKNGLFGEVDKSNCPTLSGFNAPSLCPINRRNLDGTLLGSSGTAVSASNPLGVTPTTPEEAAQQSAIQKAFGTPISAPTSYGAPGSGFSILANTFLSLITGRDISDETNLDEQESATAVDGQGESCSASGACTSSEDCNIRYGPEGVIDHSGYTICDTTTDPNPDNAACVKPEGSCEQDWDCQYGTHCEFDVDGIGSCVEGCENIYGDAGNSNCDPDSATPVCDTTYNDAGECRGCTTSDECDYGGCITYGDPAEIGMCGGCKTSDDCDYGQYCDSGICWDGCQYESTSSPRDDGVISDCPIGETCNIDDGDPGYCEESTSEGCNTGDTLSYRCKPDPETGEYDSCKDSDCFVWQTCDEFGEWIETPDEWDAMCIDNTGADSECTPYEYTDVTEDCSSENLGTGTIYQYYTDAECNTALDKSDCTADESASNTGSESYCGDDICGSGETATNCNYDCGPCSYDNYDYCSCTQDSEGDCESCPNQPGCD